MINVIYLWVHLSFSVKVKDSVIKNSKNEMPLGVIIDANLNVNSHLENIF